MGQTVNPIVLEKGLRAEFMKAYQGAPSPKVASLYTFVPSSAASEKYGWLGSSPIMSEFKDEKKPKGLLDHDYTIKNKAFEATLAVDKFSLRNDQMGAIKVRINDLGGRAKVFPSKLIIDLLVAGTSGLAYDGQAFFSASHAEGKSGTQSNLVTATGQTVAQLQADFNSSVAKMLGFKDDQGEPMFEGVEPQLLVACSPTLKGAMETALKAPIVSQTSNTLVGQADLAVIPRLSGNTWYLFDVSGGLKPFILQENMPVEFGALEGNSETGFMRRHYLYGIEWYGNAGYGLWQKAIKIG